MRVDEEPPLWCEAIDAPRLRGIAPNEFTMFVAPNLRALLPS